MPWAAPSSSSGCAPVSRAQQNKNNAVASEEHLADESVLIDALLSILSTLLRPHLFDVLEDHVAMSVECFDAGEEFAIISAVDEDLSVVAGGGHEN